MGNSCATQFTKTNSLTDTKSTKINHIENKLSGPKISSTNLVSSDFDSN